ncbi:Six-hairpin glycosidase-like protein [Amanita rubescens]|nr:Six-hairpin glycosidase-like protein [Amanita rubescens]
MMTMELLFQSAALTGNRTLTEIAMKHADTTMANHIRPDGSTWQLVEYNTFTGAIIGKLAVQGYSSNSTWSRGQAWGLYGFTKMYFHTQEPRYLDTARRLANYFIENIPDDGIIPWDFNAPLIPAPRPADSSAAMVAANGLLMLSRLETKIAASKKWRDAAIKIINPMIALAWRPSWQSLLANGTVNEPGNNSMTGTVYGDYFFIEAGNALLEMGLAACG